MNESKMFMSSTICVNACRSSSPDESEAPRDGPLLAGAPAPAPAASMAKSAAPSFAKRPFKAGAGAPAAAPAAVTYALAAPAEAPAAAPADEPPAPSRPPMSAAVSFRRRSKFGSFNEGDSVIRTQPLPAAPHPDTYDPEDYPAELGHHFRPLVYKLADAVADALAE